MAELVDARDLKSRSRKGVWVRFPLEALDKTIKSHIRGVAQMARAHALGA
jgi:hypothetical protein